MTVKTIKIGSTTHDIQAGSADKLNTNAGSATRPVYFSGGIPVQGTYTLAAACAKGVTDSTSAGAIGTGSNLVTERDIYYGLPKINNSHSYTSSTSIYAPTAGGTSGYLLVGNGTTAAPVWKSISGAGVMSANPSSIELNSTGVLSGYGGFIDFHYNGSSADYTSRIIEDASGHIKVNGADFYSGGQVTFKNTDIDDGYFRAYSPISLNNNTSGNSYIELKSYFNDDTGNASASLTFDAIKEAPNSSNIYRSANINMMAQMTHNSVDAGYSSLHINGTGTTLCASDDGDLYTQFHVDPEYIDVIGDIVLENGYGGLYSWDTTGVHRPLIWMSTADNLVIGHGTNYHEDGHTYIYAKGGSIKLINKQRELTYTYDGTTGVFRPAATNVNLLGGSSYRWSTIYAKNALNTSSDYYQKENIQEMPQKYIDMLDDINPVIFKFKDGDRLHSGYISQWIEESMNKYNISAKEFGAFCKDLKRDEDDNPIEGEYEYSLRYSEFVPILHAKIKQLNKEYKEEISKLKEEINELKLLIN